LANRQVDLNDSVLVGIGATAHSSGTPSTGNVDDFELCPIGSDAEACQAFSDDFDDGELTGWIDADVGGAAAGSSSEGGGTITVNGAGTEIWGDSDSFHYTYKGVTGNFVATLRINSWPGRSGSGKGGLMVRASGAADSAHVTLVKRPSSLQFDYRPSRGDDTSWIEVTGVSTSVSVRIARNGNTFTAFYSTGGDSWIYIGSATAALPKSVLIGMAVSSYDGAVDSGNFDDFLFCAGDAGAIEPPIVPPEEKPPGLKECVQTIELGGFEASSISPPWTFKAPDAFHTSSERHAGNFSLLFRALFGGPPPVKRHMQPWANQLVSVPPDVLVGTEGTLTFWRLVQQDPESSAPDADDHLYLAVRSSTGVTNTAGIPLAHGDTTAPVFRQTVISVETYLPGNRLADLAGQDIQLHFYGVHDGDTSGTNFYVDNVRFDICTTQPIPAEIDGTASFGGLVEVLLSGLPTKMGDGIQIFAYARGGALYATRTIHDSTYHFYNVPPGTYTIYADLWVGASLYTSTTEITVMSNERNYAVDLLLE
jgi:hypothetical protein